MRSSLGTTIAAALFTLSFLVPVIGRSSAPLTIEVLSNRADLISGGDALVRVRVPEGVGSDELTVTVGGRDVTQDLIISSEGHSTGLIDGLALGDNVLEARLADGTGATITITNHPKGGPVFAGPQVQPWICTTLENGLGPPLDDQCNAPTEITYEYQPTDASPGSYEPYDPDDPPSDVAMTTTDEGKTVPYILRVERGTLDRSIYKFIVLADPNEPWIANEPQAAWNRKVFIAFGGGCGTMHLQTPPLQPGTSFPFGPLGYFFNSAADGNPQQPELLSRGWMAIGSGLNTLNFNCNEVVSAEAVMMMKEHIIETYGPIRHTVSVGGSGGSIQQLNIAASYPGLLDGIVPTQTFPDLWNMVWDATDCYLLTHYFARAPHLWTETSEQLAVMGKTGSFACAEWIALFSDPFDPQNRGPFHVGAAVRFGCELPPSETYRPIVNPAGARCSVQDLQKAIWGREGRYPLPVEIRRTEAAPLPYDNTGVQYGLEALQRGAITAEQFIDLNAKIGAIDNEGEFTAARASMSVKTATTMYRAGRTTDARQLATVPIIDIRQSAEENSDIHQPYNSRVLRARLDAANGTHANSIIWNLPPGNMDMAGVLAMDRWLQAIEADESDLSRAEKIIANRPTDLVDTCWINNSPVTDPEACSEQYPPTANGGDARIAAGQGLTDDIRKCQLKPLQRDDYTVAFTDAQWARLQSVFPGGVCDWSRPSVGYEPSIPWTSYEETGPGGTPLGVAPESTPL